MAESNEATAEGGPLGLTKKDPSEQNPVKQCETVHNVRRRTAVKDTGKRVRVRYGSRWRKYGNDRVYFGDGYDGYIDLQTGAVEGSTPVEKVDVVEHDGSNWVVYYFERGREGGRGPQDGLHLAPGVALER